jgi:tRNA threonylcarbamoyladenosine biosynthesis protein TsaE
MESTSIQSQSSEETQRVGACLAQDLSPGDILCLFGTLGTGKTTLVKGLVRGLGIRPTVVQSPTFVLMNSYRARIPVFHFDFYRLNHVNEIFDLGYEEFIHGREGIAVIEWAERFEGLMPENFLGITLAHLENDKREIILSFRGQHYQDIVRRFQHRWPSFLMENRRS